MPSLSRLLLLSLTLAVGCFLGLSLTQLQGQPAPAAMPKEITSYRDLVKQVLPAVVSLEARVKAKAGDKSELLKPDAEKPKDKDTKKKDLYRPISTGSGVIIDANGTIVTNYHVIEGADQVEVQLNDGHLYIATEILRDPKTDLAILKIKADKPLPFLEFEDSEGVEVGDRVLAVGTPFGFKSTVTHGIISAKGRDNQNINQYEDFLQTDAAINPGNSGGALIGMNGKLLGINSNIYSRSGGFQGIGLAISSNLTREVTRQLLSNGVVKRGYLGIGGKDLDRAAADKLKVPGGVTIVKVYNDTPAAKAGLKVNDIILSIGGATIKDVATLPRTISSLPLNKPAELKIVRDDKPMTVSVTIVEQPEEFGQDRAAGRPLPKGAGLDIGSGITVMEMNDELAKKFGYEKGVKGVVIAGVAKDSPGAQAGLTPGMIIQKIDTTDVTTADKALKAMTAAAKAKTASFQAAKPNGDVDFYTVKVN